MDKKEVLEIDGYYRDEDAIFKHKGPKCEDGIRISNSVFVTNNSFQRKGILVKASPSEIKWVNTCIKANKFISKEEALKQEEPKKPELIPGKWYDVFWNWEFSRKRYIGKFREYVSGSIYFSEAYYKDSKENFGTLAFEQSELGDFTEVTSEQLQQYLPKGHPDKIVKVEDFGYVECVYSGNTSAFKANKIYKVTSINKDRFDINRDDGNLYKQCPLEGGVWRFKFSTKEAYDKQQNDELVIKEEVKMADKQQDTPWSVKYCPQFTQDIFNHLIKWCEERFKESPTQIWRDWQGKSNDKEYSWLVNSGYFVYFGISKNAKHHLCGVDNNTQGRPLISVKEMCSIIGYEQMEHPIIGEYYTVTTPAFPGKMVGKVISVNVGNTGNAIRGDATYVSTLSGQPSLKKEQCWCYEDKPEGRRFVKSTPEEIKWLEACIKANKFIPEEEVKIKLTNSDMIKGRWYTGLYNDVRYIFKVNSTTGDYLIVDHSINTKSGRDSGYSNGHAGADSFKDLQLADMEEVYKYCPEEKPKEVMKSKNVKDLVYPDVVHITSSEQWDKINKYSKIGTGYSSSYSYYLVGMSGWAQERSAYDYSGSKYTIFEFSELVFPEEEKWIPKVGEWIVAVDPQRTFGCKLQKGEVYEISYVSGTLLTTLPIGQAGGQVHQEWCRKARPEEIPVKNEEFKAGDWIIVTDFGRASAGTPGDSFQLNTPYQLSRDFTEGNGFLVKKDSKGCVDNGWSNGVSLGIKIRKCSPNEIPSENKVVESPKEKPMEKVDNNWCVKLTPENKQAIIDYSIVAKNRMSGNGAYYGNDDSAFPKFTCKSIPWGKTLTTEEFYQKIGKIPVKTSENDDWCVKCTRENSEILKAWTIEKGTPGMSMNDGAYYGWENGEVTYGSWNRTWGKILTTEEFYKKIGKFPSSAKTSDEALLEEAKRRYPHGTKFKTADQSYGNKEVYTVDEKDSKTYTFYAGNKQQIDGGWERGFLYYEGNWAEIVESVMEDPFTCELKVGDNVEAIDQTHGWASVRKGDVGIVKTASRDSYKVDFRAMNSWTGRRKCFKKLGNGVYEQLPKSPEMNVQAPAKINVELYKPKQNTQINENVNRVQSISSQLVKPKKVVLF